MTQSQAHSQHVREQVKTSEMFTSCSRDFQGIQKT